jgi:hypothetical protein
MSVQSMWPTDQRRVIVFLKAFWHPHNIVQGIYKRWSHFFTPCDADLLHPKFQWNANFAAEAAWRSDHPYFYCIGWLHLHYPDQNNGITFPTNFLRKTLIIKRRAFGHTVDQPAFFLCRTYRTPNVLRMDVINDGCLFVSNRNEITPEKL